MNRQVVRPAQQQAGVRDEARPALGLERKARGAGLGNPVLLGDKKIDSSYTATPNADGTLTLQAPEAEETRWVWVVSVAGDTLSAAAPGSQDTLHFTRAR